MRVSSVDPATFEARVAPQLLAAEARHNLMLGLLGVLRRQPSLYPDHALWLVEDGGEVVGAALRAGANRLVLAQPTRSEALAALAGGIDEQLRGVVASVPEVDEFARAWEERHPVRTEQSMAQGLYALERLLPPVPPPGCARSAAAADRELLLEWLEAFVREAAGDDDPDLEQLARTVEYRLDDDGAGFVLWEAADGPVALAGYGGQTPNGVRIGPVYTPPRQRGRGFGTAVTAAATADQLGAGRRFCFLYTDLANPTSNGIYERLGYRLVCESRELDFVQR